MRWIVDAMNVVGCRPDGWWRDRHGAMVALVEAVQAWALRTGAQVTVVLEKPPSPPIRSDGVATIVHAPVAAPNSADDEIVRRVVSDEQPTSITVVTSDSALARRVRAAGASVVAAAVFRDRIA